MTAQQHLMEDHLSEEQFADYLIGLSTVEVRSHLLQCTHCRAEMESFGDSLASFNRSSLAWSREQSAAHPVLIDTQSADRRPALRPAWNTYWAAGVVAAAVLLFAAVLPMELQHRQAAATAAVAAPAAEVKPSAQSQEDASVIAEDNQMMTAIDAEISQPDVSPVESFAAFRSQQGLSRTPVHIQDNDGQHAVRKKS